MPSRPHRVLRRANADVLPSVPPLLKLSHDTLALICDLVLPTDLLSLYRSCKSIHAFLRLGSSKQLWKAARANVEGLPECPKWFTEPQFASLCFEEFCTRCLTRDSYSPSSIWPFGVHYCLPCRNVMLTAKLLKGFAAIATWGFKSCLTDLFPGVLVGGALSKKVLCFHVMDVERLRKDMTVASSQDDPAAAAASVHAVLDKKVSDTKARLQFAEECRVWKSRWRRQQERAAQTMKLKRRQDILQKLELLGYANEVRDLGPRYQGLTGDVLSLVAQARPLNEREWSTIRPVLTTFMDARRLLGAWVTYVRLLRSRLRLLQLKLFTYLHEGERRDKHVGGARMFPTLLDLLDVKDAAYLISLPEGALLMPHFWAAQLPTLIEAWERGREGALLAILQEFEASSSPTAIFAHASGVLGMPPSITTRSATTPSSSPLSHPAALFWCDSCMSLVPGITAFSHACCYGRAGPEAADILTHLNPAADGRFSQALITSDSNHRLFKRTLIAISDGILPWSSEHLHGCVPIVCSILKACDVELRDLPKEIQKINGSRFACRACSQADRSVLAMGWLRAVSHAFEVHGGQEGSWARLSPKLEEKVKHVEYTSTKLFSAELDARTRWECSRCGWDLPQAGVAYTWPQLVNHFTVKPDVVPSFGRLLSIHVSGATVVAMDYHPHVLDDLRDNISTNFPSSSFPHSFVEVGMRA